MSNKHTPGPWNVEEMDEIFIRSKRRAIAMMKDNGLYLPWSESLANATLIAAAPDLLKELVKALRYIETSVRQEDISDYQAKFVTEIKAAIEKATKPINPQP